MTSEAFDLAKRQAEDEGLWFVAESATEAYLQQELRALHAAVERDAFPLQEVRKIPPPTCVFEEQGTEVTDVLLTIWTPRARVFVNTDLVSDDLTK